MDEEQAHIQVLSCRGESEPTVLITLVTSTSAEYWELFNKLKLFAEILQEREMKCPKCGEVLS